MDRHVQQGGTIQTKLKALSQSPRNLYLTAGISFTTRQLFLDPRSIQHQDVRLSSLKSRHEGFTIAYTSFSDSGPVIEKYSSCRDQVDEED